MLDCFQALAQEIGVSVPELNVVWEVVPFLESDRLANDKSHGLGLGFPDLLGGQGADGRPDAAFRVRSHARAWRIPRRVASPKAV